MIYRMLINTLIKVGVHMIRIIIFLLVSLMYNAEINAKTFILNTPLLKSHETTQVKNILAMLTDAFGALDIKVEFRYRPDKRLIIEAF